MASWQEQPHAGSSIWSEDKKNGIITRVDWQGKSVYANHYDNGTAVYDLDDVIGTYDERLNQWILTTI